MKGIAILTTLLIVNIISAQQLAYDWAINVVATNSTDVGRSVATDNAGNVYTTGYFHGTADFDPGPGTFSMTPNGNIDVFIQKLDVDGNFVWAKKIGAAQADYGLSIHIDDFGNVYTAGFFVFTVDFDPGVGVFNLSSPVSVDIFILKLDSDGNFIWAKSMGSTEQDRGHSIATDASGNVFTTGYFQGVVDFNPGAGISNKVSLGGKDIFVQKLDSSGNFLWAKSMGSSTIDEGNSVSVDASGNVIVSGFFSGTVDFDPGLGVANYTSTGDKDIFVQKLDPSGNFIWAKTVGGSEADAATSCKVDLAGNVYTTGYFRSVVDFDPGFGTANFTSNGAEDVFVQKLDPSGNFLWTKTVGGIYSDYSNGIDLDPSENVYISGHYFNTVDFDPSPETHIFTTVSDPDLFIQSLDPAGEFRTAVSFGGTGIDFNHGLCVDNSGSTITTGTFRSTADFNPGFGTANIASIGTNSDIFVQKLDPCIPTTGTTTVTACDSYGWIDGNLYTSSNNTATHIIANAAGCDSLVTLNLTINSSSSSTDVISACESYTWINGLTYTTSNFSALYALTNAVGCDSIVSLNLTITPETTNTNAITACDSYTWIDGNTYTSPNNTATHVIPNMAGCDSIITLNLGILSSTSIIDVQSACDSYTWIDGNTYTASNNTATYVIQNMAGCDSITTLNLSILTSTSSTDVISACESYTWIDGNTYTASNNTATHQLTNTAGCDSIITLDLTIISSTTFTDIITACESYSWINGMTYTTSNNSATHLLTSTAGCDSIVSLDLTINNSEVTTDVESACDSFTWIDGNTYTTSNNSASILLTSMDGCDSTVNLDLTINTISDVNTTLSGLTITASNANAAYQWLDCDMNYALVAGETGQTFTTTANGLYAVELTENGCVDTSACVALTTVGILENSFGDQLSIYPNPSDGKFTVDLGENFNEVKITITDLNGKVIQTTSHAHCQLLDLKLIEPTGIYMLMIEAKGNAHDLARKKAVIALKKN